jgi:hypothetical protein
MKVFPVNAGNEIWGTGRYASALGSGVEIGPNQKLGKHHAVMATESYHFVHTSTRIPEYKSHGPWVQTARSFLGLKFIIKGKVHYGWARLSVAANSHGVAGAITGYAYETIVNKPIKTNQQKGTARHLEGVHAVSSDTPLGNTLGMLARGSSR